MGSNSGSCAEHLRSRRQLSAEERRSGRVLLATDAISRADYERVYASPLYVV